MLFYTLSEVLSLNEYLVLLNEPKPLKAGSVGFIYIKHTVMKTIATLIFVLFIGVAAQAQTATEEVKVETIEMTIVTSTTSEEATLETATEVARLYKYKNSRVKKALSFTTKRNKAKMA